MTDDYADYQKSDDHLGDCDILRESLRTTGMPTGVGKDQRFGCNGHSSRLKTNRAL